MIIKKQKPIQFKNKCGCIVDEKELEKAILWYSSKPVARTKSIFMYGKYPGISIYEKKLHVHRLLAMYWWKSTFATYLFVHHVNKNRLDATEANLNIMGIRTHQSYHNKGKVLSKEHKEKIAIANRKRLGMTLKKRIYIPPDELSRFLGRGYSINKIAKHYGVDWSTIKARIYENPELLGRVGG